MAQSSGVLLWTVVATTVFALVKSQGRADGERSVWCVFGLHGEVVSAFDLAAVGLGHPERCAVDMPVILYQRWLRRSFFKDRHQR